MYMSRKRNTRFCRVRREMIHAVWPYILRTLSVFPSSIEIIFQVCLDEMVPPMRIFHCVNGHQICETCRYIKPQKATRAEGSHRFFHFDIIRSGLNPLLCPKCREIIIGRATDMENFLKVFFNSTLMLTSPTVYNVQELLPKASTSS